MVKMGKLMEMRRKKKESKKRETEIIKDDNLIGREKKLSNVSLVS
jgi:hypothetical protein